MKFSVKIISYIAYLEVIQF